MHSSSVRRVPARPFLLRALVKEGPALFLTDIDHEAITNAVRDQQPETVIVDDSHAYPDHLRSLLHVRNQTSADFRVIAVSWPADEGKVRLILPVDEENVIRLERLPADTIVEIIKNTGIAGPNELLRTIREQSAGQPGLAVTLAHLCWKDDTEILRSVLKGDALLDRLLPQLDELIGSDMTLILGAFALGGNRGYPRETVAHFLEMPISELSQRLARLAAAGIIYQYRDYQYEDGLISVRPQSARSHTRSTGFF